MTTELNQEKKESFRFDILKGKFAADGSFQKARVAGHAYLNSGKHSYKAKVFCLTKDRFIIVPDEKTTDHYKILTKEEVTTKDKGKRTYWNVVGDGELLGAPGLMKLKFDLFGETLYMSLFPANAGNVVAFQELKDWKTAA